MTDKKEDLQVSALTKIQNELNAPKNQQNDYGGYSYRSCEDILAAVKPLLLKHGAQLHLDDKIEIIGDRYYIKATAILFTGGGLESSEQCMYEVSAYAREPSHRKGMDESQITGTASSYARKYALNALFLIDDVKDADTNEDKREEEKRQPRKPHDEYLVDLKGVLDTCATVEILREEVKKARAYFNKWGEPNLVDEITAYGSNIAKSFESVENNSESQ